MIALDGDVKGMDCSKAHDVFVSRWKVTFEVAEWGMFLYISVLPLFFSFILDVSVCVIAPLVLYSIGAGIGFAMIRWANRVGTGLWIDPYSLHPPDTAKRLWFFLASGVIVFSLLSSLGFYWRASIYYGASLSEIWEYILPYVIIALAFVPSFPIVHFVMEFLKKKSKGVRVRRKQVPKSKKDLQDSVVNAFKSLGLEFEEVDEGSRMAGPLPTLKVKHHDISVRVFETGSNSAGVIMIARSPEDHGKAVEIEKGIDTSIAART